MPESKAELLREWLGEIGRYLPHQGPIHVFIHHNTLHELEDLTFEGAVEKAARVTGAEPYLPLSTYQKALESGRIGLPFLQQAIRSELKQVSEKFSPLIIPAMKTSYAAVPDESIRWLVEESEALSDLGADYWEVVKARSSELTLPSKLAPAKPVLRADQRLSQWFGAYLDQGISYWRMPDREAGFWKATLSIVKIGERGLPLSLQWFGKAFPWEKYEKLSATDAVFLSLERLAIPESQWRSYLEATLFAMQGWAGTAALLEKYPSLLPQGFPPVSLIDYLAVALLFRQIEEEESVLDRHQRHEGGLALAWYLTQVFAKSSIRSTEIAAMPALEWKKLAQEILSFSEWDKRRIFHLAYEATYANSILEAVARNADRNPKLSPLPLVKYQAVFCIDDREESFRRHLEELAPYCETFGFAGFFGVDVLYHEEGAPAPAPLCPPVVPAKHLVRETPLSQAKMRDLARKYALYFYDACRSLWAGALVTTITGLLAIFPLSWQIWYPRFTSRLVRKLREQLMPVPETKILFARNGDETGSAAEILSGYTDDEMAERVAGVLEGLGIVGAFSPLVFVFGHGSTSVNNPHESAYQCGACGGRKGAPNGRLFARFANRKEVREKLLERGVIIPEGTHFVGGCHDTCSDAVELFDTELIPRSLFSLFSEAVNDFNEARKRNAHERCRRFAEAEGLSPRQALKHVEARSQSLREARPEYGHSSNAILVVGRRALTRGLFLDRRAFFNSYDPQKDADGKILAGILAAAIPVCAGISLEYYFSTVDNEKYGCGTKLPHNVIGLIGVVNGSRSDLRTGLTLQMVEIHEPMRLLTIIESGRERFLEIIKQNVTLRRLVENRWIQVALRDPDTGTIESLVHGQWIPFRVSSANLPSYESSQKYYDGESGFLSPVFITSSRQVGMR